ncbi:MAG: hypothetical protein ABIV92_08750 [Thermoflexales bacterium]
MTRELGPAGLVFGLCAAALTQIFGAIAWAVIVSALLPGVSFPVSVMSFFATMPLKYLPGSVWNHVGKAAWLIQAPSMARTPATKSRIGFGMVGVAQEFIMLLLSGAIATLLLGLWKVPRVLGGLVTQGVWDWAFVMFVAVAIFTPLLMHSFMRHLTARPVMSFVIRLWCALILQVAGWVCGGALLGYIVIAMKGADQSGLGLSDSMFALYTGITAGLAALFVPNGLGVREWIISAAFGGSVPVAVAFAAGLVYRLFVMVSEFVALVLTSIATRGFHRQSDILTQTGD